MDVVKRYFLVEIIIHLKYLKLFLEKGDRLVL